MTLQLQISSQTIKLVMDPLGVLRVVAAVDGVVVTMRSGEEDLNTRK